MPILTGESIRSLPAKSLTKRSLEITKHFSLRFPVELFRLSWMPLNKERSLWAKLVLEGEKTASRPAPCLTINFLWLLWVILLNLDLRLMFDTNSKE